MSAEVAGVGLRLTIVAAAREWIGTPYRHQGSVKGIACDCLGLVRGVWREIYGREPEKAPAYSPDWAEASGEETLLEAARRHMTSISPALALPGDLLVFRWKPHLPAKHVAIITSAEPGRIRRIVHAYDSVGKVVEVNLANEWARRIAGAFAFPEID